jgi:hypothetical protein
MNHHVIGFGGAMAPTHAIPFAKATPAQVRAWQRHQQRVLKGK